MTSSNGIIFRITGPLCGEFTGPGEFPTQRPVTRSFDVYFDLRLNKRLSKQSWGWWFETLSRSLWRHRNAPVHWQWGYYMQSYTKPSKWLFELKKTWRRTWCHESVHIVLLNSLWPSDVIWRQRSRSTLTRVMACCLTAPSHYLNQCWLIISGVVRHSPDSNFTENTQDIYHWNEFKIY